MAAEAQYRAHGVQSEIPYQTLDLVEQTDNAKQWLDAHAQIYRLSESVFAGFASALECRSYAAAAAQASS
jgi:hypothetical protein